MSENSKIQWTDHTVNFVIGCEKVDELCANCYANELDDRRFSKTLPGASKEAPVRHWGKNAPRYLRIDNAINELIALNRKARAAGRVDKVFINSLSDTFEGREDLNPARTALFIAVAACPNLIFQLLTKRPENVNAMVPASWLANWPSNAWMGTSAGTQKSADERIPALMEIPAKIRFLSVEPMLSAVDLKLDWEWGAYEDGNNSPIRKTRGQGIHWVIVGGESGPHARPFNIEWARSIVAQCQAAGVVVFVKQLGARPYSDPCHEKRALCKDDGFNLNALQDKKGGDPSEWPADLRIRQFPERTK